MTPTLPSISSPVSQHQRRVGGRRRRASRRNKTPGGSVLLSTSSGCSLAPYVQTSTSRPHFPPSSPGLKSAPTRGRSASRSRAGRQGPALRPLDAAAGLRCALRAPEAGVASGAVPTRPRRWPHRRPARGAGARAARRSPRRAGRAQRGSGATVARRGLAAAEGQATGGVWCGAVWRVGTGCAMGCAMGCARELSGGSCGHAGRQLWAQREGLWAQRDGAVAQEHPSCGRQRRVRVCEKDVRRVGFGGRVPSMRVAPGRARRSSRARAAACEASRCGAS